MLSSRKKSKLNNANSKIKKVIPLISKYYDEDSLVNEKSFVKKISKLLKPNQWIRTEVEPREYNITMKYKQLSEGIKPLGIWASKGEWHFEKDKYLTLLEIDYSNILVLTTKQDYIDFEKKYCSLQKVSGLVKQDFKRRKLTKKNNKLSNKLNKKVCFTNIDWHKVAKDYDGIAMVPNPKPYFPKDLNSIDSVYNHLWLKTYDVSSLIIWNQNINKPIHKYKSLGKIDDIYKEAQKNEKTFERNLIKIIKDGFESFKFKV
jgi:hypothetical protein